MALGKHFSPKVTPQTQPIPGRADMVPNSAGGYTFQVSPWDQLRRFLVIGSEGGTYYVSENKLTIENAQGILNCLAEDGLRVVDETIAISEAGRAPKNGPAIFVAAMVLAHGSSEAKDRMARNLSRVCRTGTDLFTLLEEVQTQRGWGRTLRKAVGEWYSSRQPASLAYQLIKYRQRNGWTHRDALRLAHPKAPNPYYEQLFNFAVKGAEFDFGQVDATGDARILLGYHAVQEEGLSAKAAAKIVADYGLPWEALPTNLLDTKDEKNAVVFEALLQHMKAHAMLRMLNRMTVVGLLKPFSEASKVICGRLKDQDYVKKSRLHPIFILTALTTYGKGQSVMGKGSGWVPVPQVVDALDDAFYLAFDNVAPTGKRIMLALDVSGSMSGFYGAASGVLTPREITAAMAMVVARTEPNYYFMAFSNSFIPLNISAKMRLNDVVKTISGLPFSSTDCSLPMVHAMKAKLDVDAFVVYTDNETYAGSGHPSQRLNEYRNNRSIGSRLVVNATTATSFTIADPKDKGMLDICGFDSATPAVMADFIRGDLG